MLEKIKSDLRQRSKRRGFTIVELMIALVIVAVLAAVAVPTYRHLIKKAEAAGCINNIKQLWTAANTYMKDQPKERRHWPQVPDSVLAGDGEEQFWKFWIELRILPRKSRLPGPRGATRVPLQSFGETTLLGRRLVYYSLSARPEWKVVGNLLRRALRHWSFFGWVSAVVVVGH